MHYPTRPLNQTQLGRLARQHHLHSPGQSGRGKRDAAGFECDVRTENFHLMFVAVDRRVGVTLFRCCRSTAALNDGAAADDDHTIGICIKTGVPFLTISPV